MRDTRDNKAVTVIIGAFLLLAILITLAGVYQTSVVPIQQENKEIEHQRTVSGQMSNLRASIRTSASDLSSKSVQVDLGLVYDNGLIGSIRSDFRSRSDGVLSETNLGSIKIRNAKGVGSSQNYWTGQNNACPNPNDAPSNSENHCFQTEMISYSPDYRRQQLAPTFNYENSVLYSESQALDGTEQQVVRSGQNVINGKSINLKSIQASNITTSSVTPVTLDVTPVSASTNTIRITNNDTDEPVEIRIPTEIEAETWRQELLASQFASNSSDGYIKSITRQPSDPNQDINAIEVQMVEGYTYSLKLSKLNVMTRSSRTSVPQTEPAYVAWRGGNRISLRENTVEEIPAQVRDKYNNPIVGVRTKATAVTPNSSSGGVDCIGSFEVAETSLDIREGKPDCNNNPNAEQPGSRVSGDDGRLSYFYEVPEVENDAPIEIKIEVLPNFTTVSSTAKNKITKVQNKLKKTSSHTNISQPVSIDLRRFKHGVVPYNPDDPSKSLRILDVRAPHKGVSVHNSLDINVILENDGTEPIDLSDDINGRDQNFLGIEADSIGVSTNPTRATGTIEPGERQRLTFRVTFHRPGFKELEVKPTMRGEQSLFFVDVAEKTSSIQSYLIENSGEIETTTNQPSRFKDNDSNPTENFEDRDIPPVKKKGGEFQDTSQGDLENFRNFDTQSSNTTLDNTPSDTKTNVGIAHFRLPEAPSYTIDMEYSSEDGPYIIRPVGSNGKESQNNIMLALSGDQNNKNRKIHLSPQQARQIRSQNEAYFVLNNTDGTELKLRKIDIKTTEDIIKITSPEITTDNIRITSKNPTTIKADISNSGNQSEVVEVGLHKKMNTEKSEINEDTIFNRLKSKSVLVNPQQQETVTFVNYNSQSGTHTFRIGTDNNNIEDVSY